MSSPDVDTLNDYLRRAPSDEESIERITARYRGMTAEQRLLALSDLLRELAAFRGERDLYRDEPTPLWFDPLRPPSGPEL